MDMRIHITKEQFTRLSGFDLGRELIQIPIRQARRQTVETKKEVFQSLTPGQKSLFAFWVLYGHSGLGWLQFFREGLYIGGYEQFLPMIKAGLRNINDPAMLENVLLAEKLYTQYREGLNAVPESSDFNEITEAFAQASEKLSALLPETMGKLETYIRTRPEEFVVFTEAPGAHEV